MTEMTVNAAKGKTTEEILVRCDLLNHEGVAPIVFVGEPLLNCVNLFPALRVLHKRFSDLPLVILTQGPAISFQPFLDISREIKTVGLRFDVSNKNSGYKKVVGLGEWWHRVTHRKPQVNAVNPAFRPEVWEYV